MEPLNAKEARKRTLKNALQNNPQFADIIARIEVASADAFSLKVDLDAPLTTATLHALKAAEYKVTVRANNLLDITWI